MKCLVGSLNRVVGERRRPEARRGAAIDLSAECLGWAQAAHYVSAVAEDGDVQLRSMVGAPSRYFIRRRGADRLELTEAVDGDDEHPLLFVAELGVLERHLVGHFADDIRDDLDLGFLRLGAEPADLAAGFTLTDMVRGYRTLRRADGAPVAAAPDPVLSLLALVPLSHYVGWTVPDLKRSFLNPAGAPLVRNGRYATP